MLRAMVSHAHLNAPEMLAHGRYRTQRERRFE